MRSTAAGFELEVDWGTVTPYSDGAHPAIKELARMLAIDVGHWTHDSGIATPDLAYTIEAVIKDRRAVDGPRVGAPRVQLTREFYEALSDYAHRVFDFVHEYGEVVPCTEADAKHRPRGALKLVVDNAAAVQS